MAFLAGLGTVLATMLIAYLQIKASREQASEQIAASLEQADRMVAAAHEQTAVAQQQIETTIRSEQERVASETNAFLAMLEAAMARLIEEAPWG